MEQPGYYAIIPANVRYAEITDGAKLLYGEVTALCNKKGFCWANNKYFATLYGKSEDSISRRVSELVENKFLDLQYEVTATGRQRILTLNVEGGVGKYAKTGVGKYARHNTTRVNSTELTNVSSSENKPDKRNPEVQTIMDSWAASYDTDGGKNARRYAALLIKKRGLDRVQGGIVAARSVVQEQYAPAITSLEELYYKWDKLEVFYSRKSGEQAKRSVTITE